MKKVFYFDAPRDKYHCDAAILWCFDNRFELGFRKFLKRIGVVNSDPIKIAGGAKVLAGPSLVIYPESGTDMSPKPTSTKSSNPTSSAENQSTASA